MLRQIKYIIVSFGVLLIVWQLVFTLRHFNEALFPSPLGVGKSLVSMVSSGELFAHISASMYRFATGYIIAVILGIGLGLILGWFVSLFAYVNPVLQLLRPISPIAWLPFIVLWFGIGDTPAIVIIFIAAFFPVLLSTISAVGKIDKIYFKVAENFGVKQPYVLFKIVFPAAFPQIANALHVALGSAWIFLVAGEMVGAQSGLGYLIVDARNNLRVDKLMSAMIAIGLIGLILDSIIKFFEKKVFLMWGYDIRERSR